MINTTAASPATVEGFRLAMIVDHKEPGGPIKGSTTDLYLGGFPQVCC
jgi:hypothetical protein